MQNTTYYNLNIVEGTDIVNPMSVDNPNYQTIDATMYANECNSVGSATELKTGTVHALTRVKVNQNVFRFRATARYVAGDTFTVDGNVVTAQLPDGSALADGAYIIGSDVLCALVGSQLTLYVSINNGEQIMYDQNTSVNQQIDSISQTVSGLNASNLEYSTGVSIKDKIDEVDGKFLTKTVTDTTNAYGVIALHIRGGHVVSAKVTGVNSNRAVILFTYGPDWYVSVKDPTNLNNIQNTEVTVEALYTL